MTYRRPWYVTEIEKMGACDAAMKWLITRTSRDAGKTPFVTVLQECTNCDWASAGHEWVSWLVNRLMSFPLSQVMWNLGRLVADRGGATSEHWGHGATSRELCLAIRNTIGWKGIERALKRHRKIRKALSAAKKPKKRKKARR